MRVGHRGGDGAAGRPSASSVLTPPPRVYAHAPAEGPPQAEGPCLPKGVGLRKGPPAQAEPTQQPAAAETTSVLPSPLPGLLTDSGPVARRALGGQGAAL